MLSLKEMRRQRLRKPGGMSMPVWLEIADITHKRYANLRLLEKEHREGRTFLRSRPPKLIIEATNVCNLHCPGCFTGLGENGRVRSVMTPEFFSKVMDEIGDTLIEIEFFNWGEPLLCKSLPAMVADATRRGIGTNVTSNFSVPLDAEKAEALVAAGLKNLGVSLDGVSQEAYEKYRKGGDVALVFANAKLIVEAKKKLGSTTPRMIWSFHVFEHNVHEMELAKSMWRDLGFDDLSFVKGYVIGAEWKSDAASYFLPDYEPNRCPFLWNYAVIHNDGGVAPCGGTFYREDDIGRLSVKPGDGGAGTFAEVWNSKAFQDTRALFASGKTVPEQHMCKSACGECPNAKVWWKFQAHSAAGATRDTFDPGFTGHDGFNYFLTRRPPGRDTRLVLKPVRQQRAVHVGDPPRPGSS